MRNPKIKKFLLYPLQFLFVGVLFLVVSAGRLIFGDRDDLKDINPGDFDSLLGNDVYADDSSCAGDGEGGGGSCCG